MSGWLNPLLLSIARVRKRRALVLVGDGGSESGAASFSPVSKRLA
jgi:hypothetical protein